MLGITNHTNGSQYAYLGSDAVSASSFMLVCGFQLQLDADVKEKHDGPRAAAGRQTACGASLLGSEFPSLSEQRLFLSTNSEALLNLTPPQRVQIPCYCGIRAQRPYIE